MSTKSQNAKIIFGLKVKQLRMAQGLSFADLAKNTGISVSYLNEIEKGKKYPKADKIQLLAAALHSSSEELSSAELRGSMAPVSELLQSNFLNELPLDLFGIELSKVVEIIASAPARVGAFISTLVDLSRNYALREENFFFGALRAYLELHNNYFEDIERQVETFLATHQLEPSSPPSVEKLAAILTREYQYEIVENGLDPYPELQNIRSVFVPNKKKLLLNASLKEQQKAFQYGKELGFNYLQLKDRAHTASLLRVRSFEEALSHFKAGYFSAALLINKSAFIRDIRDLFSQTSYNEAEMLQLLKKYQSSPEMLFQRLTNILPSVFGLKKLFLLRFIHHPGKGSFIVDKELHLNRKHQPHSNGLSEHYCRRWVSISLLNDLQKSAKDSPPQTIISGIQRSKYYGTTDEYLCFTLGRSSYPTPKHNVSMTVGILMDEDLRQTISFWNDPAIPSRIVNNTCERCPIGDCSERAAPPHVITARAKRKKVQEALRRVMEE